MEGWMREGVPCLLSVRGTGWLWILAVHSWLHYSWIPYWRAGLPANMYLSPQNQYSQHHRHLWIHVEQQKMWEARHAHSYPWLKWGDISSCFSSHTADKCPSCGLLSSMFFTLLCFSSVTLLFKMVPETSAQGLSSVLNKSRRLMCLVGETVWVRRASFRRELWCCWLWVWC